MDCMRITGDVVAAKCCEPPLAGTYGDLVLINYASIDRDLTTVEDGVITALVLKEGERAYLFDTIEDTIEGNFSLEAGTYMNYVQHDVIARFLAKTENGKQWLNNMLCGRVVAILHAKEPGSLDGTAQPGMLYREVYGFEAGLVITALEGSTTMEDGVYAEFTLGSSDTSKERTLPKTLWYGSITATDAAIEALLAEPEAPEN